MTLRINFVIAFVLFLFLAEASFAKTSKYRVSWREDPSTSMVIGWVQESGSSPVVHYGTTDNGINYQSYPMTKTADRTVTDKGLNHHFARLTGLQPNTAYYFVIRDSDGTSKRLWFRTAPNDPTQRLSIIAGGDSRNNAVPRRNANSMVAKLRPHAVMFGGDMTDKSSDAEWQEWLEDWQLTISADGRMTPIIAERGNHDKNPDMVNIFDVPNPEVYYALNLGGDLLRIYTLNSEISVSGNQATWLANDLKENSKSFWKIAQYHRPMMPHSSSKVDRLDMKQYWEPLFYEHGVKLVVESDAHLAKSTYPIKASSASGNDQGFVRDNERGVTYVGEGCWGAPLRTPDKNKSWTRNSDKFNHFTWFFIDGEKIEVRYVKVDNASSVGSLTDNDIFAMPANIDIWTPSNGPVVTVYPNPGAVAPGPPGPNPPVNTSGISIAMGNDDVEEAQNGNVSLNSTGIELVNDDATGKGDQTIGLRFNDLKVPKNAIIEEAYIQFTCKEASTGTTSLMIKGEASDNAMAFNTSANNVSSRAQTETVVAWNPPAWNIVGAASNDEKTPDLAAIVQEIVDRPGWDSLNSMAFVITGIGKRNAFSYEGSPEKAARLVIKYREGEKTSVGVEDNEEEAEAELAFRCYPNPAVDILTVEIDNLLVNGVAEIYDLTGKPVLPSTNVMDMRTINLDVGTLPSGIYILSVKSDKKTRTKKFLVK